MKMSLAPTRLNKELKDYQKQTEDSNIKLYLVDNENIYKWQAKIKGPPDTAYAGCQFIIDINVPEDYPIYPPKCKFVTKIFHPNIDMNNGDICFELLKDKWSPQWSLESVCIAIFNLLSNPNADSPLNCDCGNLIRNNDFIGYTSLAKMYTVEYAMDLELHNKKRSHYLKQHS